MKRRILLAIALLLLPPLLLVTWLTTTESGLHWAYRQAAPYLPAALQLDQLHGQLSGPVVITGVQWQQDGMLLRAAELTLDWSPMALLGASIHIDRLQVQRLDIVLPAASSTEVGPQQPPSLPDIRLPWRMHLEKVQIDDIRLQQGEQIVQLQQLQLDASTLLSHIDINRLALRGEGFSLQLDGDVHARGHYAHKLNTRWQLQLASGEWLKGQGQLNGNLQKTRIKQRLSGPLQLTLDGSLQDLLGTANWQARVEMSRFDSARLLPNWPATRGSLALQARGDLHGASLSGTLQADMQQTGPLTASYTLQWLAEDRLADGRLQIDQLTLQAARSDTEIHARGSWRPARDGGDMALSLDWRNLRWPVTATPQNDNWFSSANGEGRIDGRLDDYRIELTTDRPWPQAPPSSWHAQARGNLSGMHFDQLHISGLQGEVTVTGQLDWSPRLAWQAQASASGLNPAGLWPEWPGKLAARFSSSGGMRQGQLFAEADIQKISGRLRGHPVSLQSRLDWRDQGIDIKQLHVRSGDARASASGRLADSLDLHWRIAADQLAHLYPEAGGQLQANGRLSGPRQAPRIHASLSGQGLSLQDYAIGRIDGKLAVDLAAWQQFDIRLTAEALKLGKYSLQSLAINGDASRLRAKAVSAGDSLQLEMRGAATADGWQGQLVRADMDSSRFHNWRLKAPARLSIQRDRLQLDTLCWQDGKQASLCASLQRQDHEWRSKLDVSQLPLLLLGPWLPPDLQLEGRLNASADLQLQAPDRLSGELQLSLPPGAVTYPLIQGERDRWEYRDGTLRLQLDEQGVHGQAHIAMGNGDHLALDGDLPGAQLLRLDRQQPLRAEAKASIHDLGLIEALLPEVEELQGEIGLKLSASGTLGQPRLRAQAHLLKGSLQIPRLALHIDQLSMLAHTDNFDALKLELAAHSGDGKLSLQGETRLDPAAGWPTRISIRGENFEASKIPEARVQVSPNLQITLQHRDISISGEVRIPYARLQPKDITTATRVSEDVVVIGGEQPVEEKWSIHTRIRLILGERVSFYGYGFEGRLGGSLLLEDEPGQLTRATGEITVPEGRYRAYGQRLDVENGRLLYTGGPLSNPGLDLRAVRRVNEVTAGIRVLGSLRRPQLELFSIPAMGETDTLSYLVLGRPMESASGEEGALMAKAALALGLSGGDRLARLLGDRFGLDEVRVESSESGDQASLVVGRYLSPKLYVSYGVGLIEAINTFTVRYQISDKWQLKAESGEAQGADLLYTIER